MKAPHGKKEIYSFYGHPRTSTGKLSKKWYDENIAVIELPYPMRIAWDTAAKIHRVPIHWKIADSLSAILTEIYNTCRIEVKRKYPVDVMRPKCSDDAELTLFYDRKTAALLRYFGLDLYGGTFNFRSTRRGSKLSMHAFAAAIDLDPRRNPMGQSFTNFPGFVLRIFREHGWKCGVDFNDPMHFQCGDGY